MCCAARAGQAAESDVFILSFINVLDTTNFINEK